MPKTKLTPDDVLAIRSAAVQRKALRRYVRDKFGNHSHLAAHIKQNLTNPALAKIYGTHPRTIGKVINNERWCA